MILHRPKSSWSITALKVQSIEHTYQRKIDIGTQQYNMVAHIIKTVIMLIMCAIQLFIINKCLTISLFRSYDNF